MSYWWHVAYSRPEFRPLRWFSRARSGCLNWLGQFPAPVQVDLISQVRTAFRFPLIHVGATAKRQSTACNVSNLSRPSGSPLPIAARCAVLAVLLMMAGARTQAQTPLPPDNQGHARYHSDFYAHLRIPGTQSSCCNNQDCRPVAHRITSTGVRFLVNGTWLTPPTNRLIQTTTPDGGAHWCGVTFRGAPPHTYCAIIPPTGS